MDRFAKMSWVICIVFVLFLFCGLASAGLLNKTEDAKNFINSLEPKAGYIWNQDIETNEGSYDPMLSGALYTFKAKELKSPELQPDLFRIGSIDLAYTLGPNDGKVFLNTMVDSKILDVFSLKLPFLGNLGLMAGLGIGVDFDKVEDWKIDKDALIWGIPTVGFKFDF